MDRNKNFAEMLRSVANPPPGDVAALGYMMRDWLQACVADAGTGIDTGGGLGCFDLWVQMGGKEIYICIKERPAPSSDERST
jgi:hypothetical protein